jgi:hypothetical protein
MVIDDQCILIGLMNWIQSGAWMYRVYKGSLPAGQGGLYGVDARSMLMRNPINAKTTKPAKTNSMKTQYTETNVKKSMMRSDTQTRINPKGFPSGTPLVSFVALRSDDFQVSLSGARA